MALRKNGRVLPERNDSVSEAAGDAQMVLKVENLHATCVTVRD